MARVILPDQKRREVRADDGISGELFAEKREPLFIIVF